MAGRCWGGGGGGSKLSRLRPPFWRSTTTKSGRVAGGGGAGRRGGGGGGDVARNARYDPTLDGQRQRLVVAASAAGRGVHRCEQVEIV